jgi:hypothetical protein
MPVAAIFTDEAPVDNHVIRLKFLRRYKGKPTECTQDLWYVQHSAAVAKGNVR